MIGRQHMRCRMGMSRKLREPHARADDGMSLLAEQSQPNIFARLEIKHGMRLRIAGMSICICSKWALRILTEKNDVCRRRSRRLIMQMLHSPRFSEPDCGREHPIR